MKRKDMLIKELQYKLEHNEGCKYSHSPIHSSTNIIFISRGTAFSFRDFTLTHFFSLSTKFRQPTKLKSYSLCLVIVMRTTADDGGSSSASCVVDSFIESQAIEPVGVNKCVNISSDSFDSTSYDDDNNFLLSDRSAVDHSPIYENIATELDSEARCLDEPIYDVPSSLRTVDDDDKYLNKFFSNIGDDDDDDVPLTSSKYSDVTSGRCEMLDVQPSTSSAASSDAVCYAPTRDNNRKHQKAVRENFSLWIGVTSCVWGLLLLLMKNYAD